MSEGRFNLQSPASDPQGQRLKHVLFSPRLESLLEIEEYMFWIFFKDKERIFFFFYDFIYLFLEKGEGKKKEGNISVWLPPPFPLLGTWPATQACVLTRNQTGDAPLVHRPALNPRRSYTNQGCLGFFLNVFFVLFCLGHYFLGKKETRIPR